MLTRRFGAVIVGLSIAFAVFSKVTNVRLLEMSVMDAFLFFTALVGLLCATWGMFDFSIEKSAPLKARLLNVSPTVAACALVLVWMYAHSAMSYLWIGVFLLVFSAIPFFSKFVGNRLAAAISR